MRFRGPGQVLGTRQSGVPDFTWASLVEDEEVLVLARQAADKVIEMDVTLERWYLMKEELRYRYERYEVWCDFDMIFLRRYVRNKSKKICIKTDK